MHEKALKRWITSLVIVFVIMGMAWGTWLTRFPTLRDTLDYSLSQMSVLVLMPSLGVILGLLLASSIVPHFGERGVIVSGMAAMSLSLPLGTWALLSGQEALSYALLFIYGAGFGVADVASNVSGSSAERIAGRSRMMLLHGGFSIGGIGSVLIGALAEATNFSVLWHQVLNFAIGFAVIAFLAKYISPKNMDLENPETVLPITGQIAIPPSKPTSKSAYYLMALGFIALAGSLADGVANDWMPLAFIDEYGLANAPAVSMLALMYLSELIMRLVGDNFVSRLGRRKVLRITLASSFAGIMLVALSPTVWLAIPGALLWGIGSALAFPVSISSAADDAKNSARNVSAISTFGYSAYAMGPVAFGFMGDHWGLRIAFVVLAVIMAFSWFAAGAVRERA